MTDLSLNLKRVIQAPIKEVFEAWLDPHVLAQIMVPAPNMHVPKAEADPREGGKFTIVMATGEQEIIHTGEYLTLDRYGQIVFTWNSPFSAEGSTVTLNFSESGSGTEVELIHIRLLDEESRDNHANGWSTILANLDRLLVPNEA